MFWCLGNAQILPKTFKLGSYLQKPTQGRDFVSTTPTLVEYFGTLHNWSSLASWACMYNEILIIDVTCKLREVSSIRVVLGNVSADPPATMLICVLISILHSWSLHPAPAWLSCSERWGSSPAPLQEAAGSGGSMAASLHAAHWIPRLLLSD